MKKETSRRLTALLAAAALAGLSALLYAWHYALFHDAHHIWIYLVGDIAFLPLDVLIVTVVLHRLLTVREKRQLMSKLNMVIGAFFSEVGGELLRGFVARDQQREELRKSVHVTPQWTRREFAAATSAVAAHKPALHVDAEALEAWRGFLHDKRAFLLGLLQNPNLLEHERFTDMLWAVLHFGEELDKRGDVATLPETDLRHLAGDAARAYGRVATEWLAYMEHLKSAYPYLFSLAVRTSPFAEMPRIVVAEG